MIYTYDYPRPAVTTDCLIFTKDKVNPEILLIKRLNKPYEDQWAFPGGFLEMNEELKDGSNIPKLAFDHKEILHIATQKLFK